MRNVRLVHSPLSRSMRVLWTCHELGVPVAVEPLDLLALEQYGRPFRARNPNANVPLLEWDEGGRPRSLFESAAIVRFLAERHGRLVPPLEAPERALFEQTFQWQATSVDMLLWQMRMLHDFRGGQEQEYLNSQFKRWNAVVAPQLEKLCASSFVVGDAFSIADVLTAHNIFWAKKYQDHIEIGPNARQYLKNMAARPAFQKAIADKDQFKASKL